MQTININIGPNLPEHEKHFIRRFFESQFFQVEFTEIRHLDNKVNLITDPERAVSKDLSKRDIILIIRTLEAFKIAHHYYKLSQKYLNTIRTKRLIKQPI